MTGTHFTDPGVYLSVLRLDPDEPLVFGRRLLEEGDVELLRGGEQGRHRLGRTRHRAHAVQNATGGEHSAEYIGLGN